MCINPGARLHILLFYLFKNLFLILNFNFKKLFIFKNSSIFFFYALFSYNPYYLISFSIFLFEVLHRQKLTVGNTIPLPGEVEQVKVSHEFPFSVHCGDIISPVQAMTSHCDFSGHHLETD